MKTLMTLAAAAALMATAACATSEPAASYANPMEACAGKATEVERDECMRNMVADVAMSAKREAKRKPPR